MTEPITVASLVCHRDVDVAVACLSTLPRFSKESVKLRLHEDGTLTDEDRVLLREKLGGARIIDRKEADARMAEALAKYPACAAYRRLRPHGIKLFDILEYETGPNLAFLDADVAFFQPFTGLFVFPTPAVNALMMTDNNNSYALRSWHLLRRPGWRIGRWMNSGLMYWRKSHFDYDLAESYFRTVSAKLRTNWQEQTCWALQAMRAGCRLWDARQVCLVGKDFAQVHAGVVAGHFCPVAKVDKPMVARELTRRVAEVGVIGPVRVRVEDQPPEPVGVGTLLGEELTNLPGLVRRRLRGVRE